MRDMIRGLLGSKKAMVMILTLVAMAVAKLGWDVSGEQLYTFLAPVIAYLLAQGWADKGKSAAIVDQETHKLISAVSRGADPSTPAGPSAA